MKQVEYKILGASGKEVGTTQLPLDIFGTDIPVSVLHQVVRWQRARWRSGTHAVQTRAEMSGGGKKPWRQKGTGNARSGSNTSPVWVGGGIAHGPKPRSYEFSVNKKVRRKALCAALSARMREQALTLVDSFELAEVGTKKAIQVLKQIGLADVRRILVVVSTMEAEGTVTLMKSLRNVSSVKVVPVAGLNVYDVLRTQHLVVFSNALETLSARLLKQ